MYEVIANAKAFEKWLECQEYKHVKKLIASSDAVTHLRRQLKILDNCYGEERDLEKDLGGYMVIFYGDIEVAQNEYKQILRHHYLKENEFEYEEIYRTIAENESIAVRLYLCSSDYSVVMVNISDIKKFNETV